MLMQPSQFFKALGDDTRLKCLLLLSQSGQACVCDLMAALQLDQPKTSRQLAALRKCGILLDQRRGKWVYYSLHPELPAWALAVIKRSAADNPDYFSAELHRLKQSFAASSAPC